MSDTNTTWAHKLVSEPNLIAPTEQLLGELIVIRRALAIASVVFLVAVIFCVLQLYVVRCDWHLLNRIQRYSTELRRGNGRRLEAAAARERID